MAGLYFPDKMWWKLLSPVSQQQAAFWVKPHLIKIQATQVSSRASAVFSQVAKVTLVIKLLIALSLHLSLLL